MDAGPELGLRKNLISWLRHLGDPFRRAGSDAYFGGNEDRRKHATLRKRTELRLELGARRTNSRQSATTSCRPCMLRRHVRHRLWRLRDAPLVTRDASRHHGPRTG